MNNVRLAIVGATGVVGRTVLKVLEEENLPINEYVLFASSKSKGKFIDFFGKKYIVHELDEHSFDSGFDFAIFSAGASTSLKYSPIASKNGCIVIDNSSAFRMDDNVPLVVPEVNSEEIKNNCGIIANPNCSTIQAVVPLKILDMKYRIKRIVYSTYQAVSGAGKNGIADLQNGITDYIKENKIQIKKSNSASMSNTTLINNDVKVNDSCSQAINSNNNLNNFSQAINSNNNLDKNLENFINEVKSSDYELKKFDYPIFNNCLPHIDDFLNNGYTKEEMKMVNETRKILKRPELPITATAVRVPVFNSHSESINVEFEKDFILEDLVQSLNEAKNIVIQDYSFNNLNHSYNTINSNILNDTDNMINSNIHNKSINTEKSNSLYFAASFPLSTYSTGHNEVFIGRIRRDFSVKSGINFWCVADNIRKGAASNAIQILELLLK